MVVAENGAAGWAGIVEDGRGRPSLHRFETGDARRYIDSKRGEGRPSLHRFETSEGRPSLHRFETGEDARRYIDSKRAGTPVAALRWRMEAVSSIK